jgi:hypothetical protein
MMTTNRRSDLLFCFYFTLFYYTINADKKRIQAQVAMIILSVHNSLEDGWIGWINIAFMV